jgi:F0F1-type ATP synthase assembly protein I
MSNDNNSDYDLKQAKALKDMDESELSELNEKIIKARHKADEGPDHNSAEAQGMRVATEIIASPVAGGILGYLIDMALGSSPAFLIIMIVAGMCAGFYRAYKLSQ